MSDDYKPVLVVIKEWIVNEWKMLHVQALELNVEIPAMTLNLSRQLIVSFPSFQSFG